MKIKRMVLICLVLILVFAGCGKKQPPAPYSFSPAGTALTLSPSQVVAFSVTANQDDTGNTYEWAAGGGSPANGAGKNFTWTAPDTETVEPISVAVTVKDASSNVLATHSWSVTVNEIRITIDAGDPQQVIDGFGTCLSGTNGSASWFQDLYYDDAMCSILRIDLVPRFDAPYSDMHYNCPWWGGNPGDNNCDAVGPPDAAGNLVRTYTNAQTYTDPYYGVSAQICVMGPDINVNKTKFNYDAAHSAMAQLGQSKTAQLGDFKLIGSIWSPAPWLKVSSGNTCGAYAWPLPKGGEPYPFIWAGNFTGGKLDTSNTPLPVFYDGVEDTSALTQFARCTAAYIKGFQDTYGVQFHSISIQNELNFETFYNSCTYRLSSEYIAALKAVRAEFDKYADLMNIKIMGPEDLLGGDGWGMWEYGGPIHKNLQYLQNIDLDPEARAALEFFCIHGYASDGVSSAGASPTQWLWWANGWTSAPAGGLPSNVKGFTYYNKKSWMTETSGENTAWLSPSSGFPSNGAYSIAIKIHQAFVSGKQSAWVYWQMADDGDVKGETLTDDTLRQNSPKYVAFKHFSRYIRPGAVLLPAASEYSDIMVSAYRHDADRTLTIVLINTSGTQDLQVTVSVPDNPAGISSFASRTSKSGSYWQTGTVTVAGGRAVVTVPKYGVVTLYGQGS
ncbi:MAG: hypothetical protein ACM3WV_01515 [Bacillota bacterium]